MNTTNPHFVKEPCSLQFIWRGYCDWYQEKVHGPAAGEQPTPSKGARPASVLWLLLVIPAGVLAIAVLFPLMAPAMVSGMSAAGPAAVANASMGLSAVAGLGFFLGLPILAGLRVHRFLKMCCLRGQELNTGLRKPAGKA